MPQFNKTSQEKLLSCHSDLQRLFEEVNKRYECIILEGHRNNKKQDELYHQGKSKLKAGMSKHNKFPSLAIDAAPYSKEEPHINWNDKTKFYHFVGYVKATADQMRIKIRCGADWDGDNDLTDQTFFDLVHFELI
jgi:peptidoglycan L-alanyl-D-glutamate endopeptidase CwlK